MVDDGVSDTRVIIGSVYAVGASILFILGSGFADMGLRSTSFVALVFAALLVVGLLELVGALPNVIARQFERLRGVFHRGDSDA